MLIFKSGSDYYELTFKIQPALNNVFLTHTSIPLTISNTFRTSSGSSVESKIRRTIIIFGPLLNGFRIFSLFTLSPAAICRLWRRFRSRLCAAFPLLIKVDS